MSICLCDISALEVIRSSGKLVDELLESPRCSSLDGCRAPSALELEDLVAGLGVRTRPIHVLVPRGGPTRAVEGACLHYRAGSVPRGSLIRMRNDVLIAGPELAICQLAARDDIDLVGLAKIVFELCGTYLLDQDEASWKGFINIERPVTSIAQIERTLAGLGRVHGSVMLRKALSVAVEGAHSPMETVLAMLLTMPRIEGGLGIKGLFLNYPVNTGSTRAIIDAAIPALKVGLEYKGRAYHTIEQSGRDDRRQNGLVGLGWTILNVWNEDLKDDLLFERLQAALFRALDYRFRPSRGFNAAQWRLRHRLVPGHR